jgi:hypothetical protein
VESLDREDEDRKEITRERERGKEGKEKESLLSP